jgi:hypothetical protein
MLRMGLTPEQLSRRIKSAIVLRGSSQAKVGERMEAAGFGYHDIALIERCDPIRPKFGFTPERRYALSGILNVPQRWFSVPDEELFERPVPELVEVLDRIERLEEILSAVFLTPLGEETGEPPDLPAIEPPHPAQVPLPTETPSEQPEIPEELGSWLGKRRSVRQ